MLFRSEITTGAVTDLQAVAATMNNISKLFANGTPSVTTMTNSGLFDTTSTFMDNGRSFGEFATQTSTDQSLIGITFSNIDIVLTSATTATLTTVGSTKNGILPEMISIKMKKVSTGWVIIGDQHIAEMQIASQAIYTPQSTTAPIKNGLKFLINPFAYNATHSAAVASADITGPGLLVAISMSQSSNSNSDGLQLTSGGDQIPECTNTATTPCVDFTKVTDGSVYRIELKDTNGKVLEDLNTTLPKAPVATSTLSAASFPAITSVMVNGVPLTSANFTALVAGANLTFTWSLPASYKSDYLSAWAGTNNGQYYNLQKDFLPTETKTTFTLGSSDITATGIVTNTGVWLSARDGFNREFVYSGWVQ